MKLLEDINDELKTWIKQQPMFFVASAPLAADGHVNLSPRGYDCFRVLDNHTVAWLDLTGSGNETAAHIQENGRITIMFCAFEGEPQILRLFGQGETLLPGSHEWNEIIDVFPDLPGARQIIRVNVERVQASCGFSVPLMKKIEDRTRLLDWAEKKGEAGISEYRKLNNMTSIDGIKTKINN